MRMTLMACLFASFVTQAFAADVAIDTAAGPVTLPDDPKKLAVYDIAAADTLNALSVTINGVPEKLYVGYLDAVRTAAQPIGTLFEPNLEALATLAPDVIVVGSRSSEKAKALSQIAPVIDMTISGNGIVGQARARLTAFGKLFGREAEAADLSAKLDTRIAEVRQAVAGKGKALIILTNGGKISAFGSGSRFGWLHEDLGIPQAAEGLDAKSHGMAISFEFIAETNPDWLLVVDRGAAIGQAREAAKATLDNALVAKTTAAQKGQIIYLDPAPLYIAGGGITSMNLTIDEILAAFATGQDG